MPWRLPPHSTKNFKLPLCKSCQVLEQCFGLSISAGGLAQAIARVAKRLEPSYEKALADLRHSDEIYSDRTKWWLNGSGYTLWVFTNQQTCPVAQTLAAPNRSGPS
ncbi:MAG: transposase [Leptolyngbyaceae cyanobacterium SL_5_9]|nr:transposase [Leptolyngbyaceae cyanobacterium SL_5_9]NJO74461.1 transposase [Leptolyngbyaceae cyanobacterium RM1_406_9]